MKLPRLPRQVPSVSSSVFSSSTKVSKSFVYKQCIVNLNTTQITYFLNFVIVVCCVFVLNLYTVTKTILGCTEFRDI